ncbi:MAG: hypothetical protein F6K18_24335 [Okeania sp. SIO2C2]|uniref:hypothetical protein n=1 Tax=Okeania sp. SIO2C2 TaxID=2607787 RepID=UPI0013B9138E|nr:hypothetical protein [Okeania sp. SIO2C2]NEP89708.1 hypothetical protein [Okeania sp. SIO2C2]
MSRISIAHKSAVTSFGHSSKKSEWVILGSPQNVRRTQDTKKPHGVTSNSKPLLDQGFLD